MERPEEYYQSDFTSFVDDVAVSHGWYNFTINDSHGDGMCCSSGEGSYSVQVDGDLIFSGGEFGKSETRTFEVGTTFSPSQAPVPASTLVPTRAPNAISSSIFESAPTIIPVNESPVPILASSSETTNNPATLGSNAKYSCLISFGNLGILAFSVLAARK